MLNKMDFASKEVFIAEMAYSILLFLGFIFFLIYLIRHIRTQKFNVYWVDFIYIYLIFFAYAFLRIFSNYEDTSVTTIRKCHFIISILLTSEFIMNSINSCILINQISKYLKIQYKGKKHYELTKLIGKFDPVYIYRIKVHLLVFIISFGVIFIIGLTLLLVLKEKKKEEIFDYLSSVIGFFFLLIQLILMKVLETFYKKLIKIDDYSNNFINDRIINKTKVRLFTVIEQFMYKALYDFILNIPCLISFIFLIHEETQEDKIRKLFLFRNDKDNKLFIGFLCFESLVYYLYFVLLSSLSATIDKENGGTSLCIFNGFYLGCIFKYAFYSKSKVIKLYKSSERKSIRNSISSSGNKAKDLDKIGPLLYLGQDAFRDQMCLNSTNEINNVSDSVIRSSFVSRTSSVDASSKLNESTSSVEPEENEEDYELIKDYLPCTFYVIFKIIYLFFKANEKIYLKVEKTVEDEGIPFRYCNNALSGIDFGFRATRNSKLTNRKSNFNPTNYLENISRISRISVTNQDRIVISRKFTLDYMMNSLNDKLIKEEFINRFIIDKEKNRTVEDIKKLMTSEEILLTNTTRFNNTEFKIESLCCEQLFELFPFYQISINDLLNSLEVNNNKECFEYFFAQKKKEKSLNYFTTKDNFLSFEIYDSNFISYEKLKDFISNYKAYLIENLTNFSFTFLPLIIGIFNIKYLDYNKVVLLFKNPISFAPFINFHVWINYVMTDNTEKMTTSTKNSTIADINEIEVNNNIKLDNDEYEETRKILKSDLKFLKQQSFELNLKLNLFVINDIAKNDLDSSQSSLDNSIINRESKLREEQFENAIRDTNYFINENALINVKKYKKYFGSDVISLLEKLYINVVGENKYLLKIYFSELFKKKKYSIASIESMYNKESSIRSKSKKSVHKHRKEDTITKDIKTNIADDTNLNLNFNLDAEISDSELREKNKKYCKLLKIKLFKKIEKDLTFDLGH